MSTPICIPGNGKNTPRNQFTRQCIAEALFRLLESRHLEDISVTELSRCAGISRMTFYKYYQTKQDVLTDFLNEMVTAYVQWIAREEASLTFRDYAQVLNCLEYFKTYGKYIHTLVRAGLYGLVIDAVNGYMEKYVRPISRESDYALYYYAGALCNIFVKWVENGMRESPSEIAAFVKLHA
jgi:AcrR family transcriptional regulator